MIDKYENFDFFNNEINKFMSNIQCEINKNEMKNCAKILLFMKQIRYEINNLYYFDCMFSDILMELNFLNKKSKRIFFIFHRSLIENSIRYFLDIHMDEYIGINDLFKKFKEFCAEDGKMLYSNFKVQYDKCCDYVHNNPKASLTLYEYFEDIRCKDELSPKELKKCFAFQLNFLRYVQELIIIKNVQLIDKAFFRKTQLLKFLLSKKANKLFNKYVARTI